MSWALLLARAITDEFLTFSAISFTLKKSAFEQAGKPASIASTFIASSRKATSNFSLGCMVKPGACSPSRRVVSKILIFIFSSFKGSAARSCHFYNSVRNENAYKSVDFRRVARKLEHHSTWRGVESFGFKNGAKVA